MWDEGMGTLNLTSEFVLGIAKYLKCIAILLLVTILGLDFIFESSIISGKLKKFLAKSICRFFEFPTIFFAIAIGSLI